MCVVCARLARKTAGLDFDGCCCWQGQADSVGWKAVRSRLVAEVNQLLIGLVALRGFIAQSLAVVVARLTLSSSNSSNKSITEQAAGTRGGGGVQLQCKAASAAVKVSEQQE